MSSSGRAPIQPGRIAESPISPLSRRSGPGTPMPTPVTRSASTPTSSSSRRTSRPASAMPVGGGVVDVDGLLGLGQDGVGEVGDRDADVRVAEVDADRDARRAAQRERRAAAAVALLEPALVAQLARDARHRRRREAARAREVGLRHRPAGAQQPEQPLAVRRAQLARGAGASSASLDAAWRVAHLASDVRDLNEISLVRST